MSPEQIARLAIQSHRASGCDLQNLVSAYTQTYCYTQDMIAKVWQAIDRELPRRRVTV